jgi:predicted ATPase
VAGTGRVRRVGSLPAETTSFVGRRAELALLAGLLEEARLVTVTGVGGVGKTRLARRAADEACAVFPDGVWLVELSSLRDPALVGIAILEGLRLADQTTRPVAEVLAGWLADKRLLLVLDTCEHLIDACARVTDTLLEAAPGLHILATSRQPLGVPAERQMAVSPLPVDTDSRGEVAGSGEAVTLFRERAAAVVPSFELTEGNRETVAGICRRLDGIPLAIEFATARLSELSVDELSERLHSRFELLTAEDSSGLPRHRTLRTTIGWSHELCAPLERLLWARLAVFAGGFDLEAAEYVCSGGPLPAQQLRQVLDGLVDKSIVRPEQRNDNGAGPVRYRMLDTVREYGGQWLRELGEEHQTQRRHRDHYLRLARQGDVEWMGPDQVAWYERTVSEHANLRAALEFSLTEPDGHTALELTAGLWFYWYACGFLREGRQYLERALADDPQPSPVRTKALWACGVVAGAQGDTETSLRMGTACQQAAQDQGDADALLAGTNLVGASLSLNGEPARAAAVFDQAPPAPSRRGGYKEAARLMNRVARAFVHVQLGEFAQGAALGDEVRAECSRRGEQWVRAYADYVRAVADFGRGETASAVTHARAALEGKRPLHDTPGIAMAIDLLALAVASQGEGERAARLLGIAQQLWQTVGRPQLGSQELTAARALCERQAREAIGDAAYEAAYKAGLETDPEGGVAHALATAPAARGDT